MNMSRPRRIARSVTALAVAICVRLIGAQSAPPLVQQLDGIAGAGVEKRSVGLVIAVAKGRMRSCAVRGGAVA